MRSRLVRHLLRPPIASQIPRRCASQFSPSLFVPSNSSSNLAQTTSTRCYSQSHNTNNDSTISEPESTMYLGVVYNAAKVKKYSAEIDIESHVISGGEYWTALEAAKAYDELVTLYCDLDEPRNFPESSIIATKDDHGNEIEWQAPDAGSRHADLIPCVPKTYLTIQEVQEALERENAIDVYTINLAGKSSLADYMVFATGRSQAHMRRMADLLIQSIRTRAIMDDFDYIVEGRDCDDWMIADCNTIVIHLMCAKTRRILALEDHWENMVEDKHRIYGNMSEDEYMDKFGTSELMEDLDKNELESDCNSTDDAKIDWK
ncbi:hypothetical protein CCR75_001617 [Bremia lactucae]|uniref:Iojap-like ribosome-associated protein n=1 Tax=Bremia lactucae TaxID=4779 RepID=A0A976FPA0_BRELC|nr:hypothetical protein CCR75_001617 [Bremia lactucae]